MKTITLTDAAYLRLRDWKQSADESFSAVVLKVVPERGTFGQMLQDVGQMPPLSRKSAKVMDEAAAWGRDAAAHRDAWTS